MTEPVLTVCYGLGSASSKMAQQDARNMLGKTTYRHLAAGNL